MNIYKRTTIVHEWDELPLLMTTAEVANLLHTSDEHVRLLAVNGTIKGAKTARKWLINKHDLRAYLENISTGQEANNENI